jgi:hypothetical protein
MPKRIKPPVRWQYDPWARFSAAVLTQAVADANRGDAEAALWLCEPALWCFTVTLTSIPGRSGGI